MYQIAARASINTEMSGYNVLGERKMAFIVLDKTYTQEGKVRYIQFGDECETLQDVQKLALSSDSEGSKSTVAHSVICRRHTRVDGAKA